MGLELHSSLGGAICTAGRKARRDANAATVRVALRRVDDGHGLTGTPLRLKRPRAEICAAAQRHHRRTLITQRADVNARQPDGATAIAWGEAWDDLDTADVLIRAGVTSTYQTLPRHAVDVAETTAAGDDRQIADAGADPKRLARR